MLTENNFSKYLIYAIGEVILVVIGILIALNLNNSKELRKLEETKQSYFNQLLIDIKKDSTTIDGYIIKTERSIDSYQSYLNYFKTADLSIEEIHIKLNEVERTFSVIGFNTNTIEMLTSTGDIKLMPVEIRNILLKIKRTQTLIKDIQKQNDREYLHMLMNARQLGFSNIELRLENQPKYAEFLRLSENNRDAILILEAAFRLKNYSETNRVDLLKINQTCTS